MCPWRCFPPGHLSVHPKVELTHHKSLTQYTFHLMRMQLKRLWKCALGVDFPPGYLSVHPKVEWCYHLSLTQCAFHLVRMQLYEQHHVPEGLVDSQASQCCPTTTFAIPGNPTSKHPGMIDLEGENGNADRYRCGVLLPMIPEKNSINLIQSLTHQIPVFSATCD